MNIAIKVLEDELNDVSADIKRYGALRRSTPSKMRPSEWAMTLASLEMKKRELGEAIATLNGLRKDNDA